MRVRCPSCLKSCVVNHPAGTSVSCPYCGKAFLIPEKSSGEKSASAPAPQTSAPAPQNPPPQLPSTEAAERVYTGGLKRIDPGDFLRGGAVEKARLRLKQDLAHLTSDPKIARVLKEHQTTLDEFVTAYVDLLIHLRQGDVAWEIASDPSALHRYLCLRSQRGPMVVLGMRQIAAEIRPRSLDSVDLNRLYRQFQGASYARMVQEHLRKGGRILEAALIGCVQAFDEKEREVAEVVVDEYNRRAYDYLFWRQDCADVFAQICSRFAQGMAEFGLLAEDAAKFNMFQMVTLNFAQAARDQKALRQFAGIKKGWFFT